MTSAIIGTGEDCDIRVEDEYASAHHCRVWTDEHGRWVADLGSTNGTRVRFAPHSSPLIIRGPFRLPPGRSDAVLIVGRTEIPLSRIFPDDREVIVPLPPEPPSATVCALLTFHADGTMTATYHGPIGETQRKLIAAFAGPAVSESLFSADDLLTLSQLSFGAVINHGATP